MEKFVPLSIVEGLFRLKNRTILIFIPLLKVLFSSWFIIFLIQFQKGSFNIAFLGGYCEFMLPD